MTVERVEPVMFNPFEPGFFENPYVQYRALREQDPVHRSPLGTWMLFRYDDVLRVLRDSSLSVDDANAANVIEPPEIQQLLEGREHRGEHSILGIDPPDHTRLRRLVSKAFTPRMVERLRPRAHALVDEALDRVDATGAMDVIDDLAFPLPFEVISELLGMPDADRAELRGWSHTLAGTLDPIVSTEQMVAALDASDHMREHCLEAVRWKRATPADDLLSALLAAEDNGDVLSDDELLDQIVLLFIAGHETTVNLIGNGSLALLRHRDQLERLQADPALDAPAVDELLRYDSPVQFSRRITLQPLEIAGFAIDPGEFVMTCLGGANHDPAAWGDDADELDLTRKADAMVMSFGGGAHYCLGASLARLEAQVALGTLVRRYPGIELATDAPEWNNRVVLRGLDHLPVSLGR